MKSDVRVPNRPPPTFLQIVNPIWWASDIARNTNWNWLLWFLRNPFCNFKSVILGVAHKTRTVYWKNGDGWTYALRGWNYGYTVAKWLPLPFVSYRGARWEWSLGWETNGAFSTDFRRVNSPNATEHP